MTYADTYMLTQTHLAEINYKTPVERGFFHQKLSWALSEDHLPTLVLQSVKKDVLTNLILAISELQDFVASGTKWTSWQIPDDMSGGDENIITPCSTQSSLLPPPKICQPETWNNKHSTENMEWAPSLNGFSNVLIFFKADKEET